VPRPPKIEIVHLAHTTFPQDTRVKREVAVSALTGRRVAVVTLRGPGQRPIERVGLVTIVRIRGGRSRRGPISYLREYTEFTLRCRWLLARHRAFSRARLVHVHTLPDFLIWAARPVRQRGGRVILDLHEIFPEFARAKYAGVFGRVASTVARAIERMARRRADVTITVNAPIEELLARRPIGRPERLVVVHNSADPEDFGPPREPRPPNPHRAPIALVYHGTLTPLYGLDVAIRGIAAAAARGVEAHLAILGDGTEQGRLEALASQLGLAARVTFEGRLPQTALPARLCQADAAIVPTRLDGMTRYSLSNKLLEYVHLGIPVLATRLPSYLRYLGEDAAWYWNSDDPADCARALLEFAAATTAERAARAGCAQARLTAIAWPGERNRLLTVYQELLEDS
jgi:glycosyltransferase involved in cell wall biosynthesis